MGDPVVVERWHVPWDLSGEALRLLTSLPMEEIERRLRMNEPTGHERPTDEELLRTYGLAKRDHDYEGPIDDWPKRAERAAVVAGLRAVLARWGTAPQAADEEIAELVAWLRETGELLRSDIQYRFDLRLFYRAADLLELERQPLRPIPVAERLPGPEDCRPWPDEPGADPWCWLGSNVDGDWGWEQRSAKSLSYHNEFTHWLPAHALPLPEFDHE